MLKKIFLIAFALVTLTACADLQVGNEAANDFGRYTQLQKGSTTKAEVYELFGQPSDVTYNSDGSSEWDAVSMKMRTAGATYIPFVGLLAGGSRQDIRVATFQFNARGRFKSVKTTEHSVYSNQWEMLARAGGSVRSPSFERVEKEMQKLGLDYDKNTVVPPELYNSPKE